MTKNSTSTTFHLWDGTGIYISDLVVEHDEPLGTQTYVRIVVTDAGAILATRDAAGSLLVTLANHLGIALIRDGG